MDRMYEGPETPERGFYGEITPEIVERARTLCLGYKGRHDLKSRPEEVVEILRSMPGIRPALTAQNFMEALAWLLDLPEMPETKMRAEGIPEHLIAGVKMLTPHPKRESIWSYYLRVDEMPEILKTVKVAERISAGGQQPRSGMRRELHWLVRPLTYRMPKVMQGYFQPKLTFPDQA